MTEAQAAKKSRPVWVYLLVGCGAVVLLTCLGAFAVAATGYLKLKGAVADMKAGLEDDTVKAKNAREQLGGIPEGYEVVASISLFGMGSVTVLTDGLAGDGGIVPDARTFQYFRLFANEQNEDTKRFFRGEDARANVQGIGIEPDDVVKRGRLSVDGRSVLYVVGKRVGENGREELGSAILFECPGDALHAAMWAQPLPQAAPAAAEAGEADSDADAQALAIALDGTVGDEAELSRFLRPINPCR